MSFSNEVYGGVWSGGPTCSVGSSNCLGMHKVEVSDTGTDTARKPEKLAEGRRWCQRTTHRYGNITSTQKIDIRFLTLAA